MIDICPYCKKGLHTDHIFCPNCGEDLRNYKNLSLTNQPIRGTKIRYSKYIYEGLIWSVILTIIVSFYYTFPKFNLDLFLQGIIGRPFLVIALPFILVQLIKRDIRENAFKYLVRALMVILTITQTITLIGQNEFKKLSVEETKVKVRQECVASIVRGLEKIDVSEELKKFRGEKYCDCIIGKLNDNDFIELSNNPKLIGNIVQERYKTEDKECIVESLKGKPGDIAQILSTE